MKAQANLYADRKNVASYEGSRPDILGHVLGASRVLDVGCNRGALVRELKQRFPECRCWGIEINPDALKDALPELEAGYVLDLDRTGEFEAALEGLQFDTIIAGDVLEHTWDPWRVVEVLYGHLAPGGVIIISLPNIAHWTLLTNWIRLSWPIRERGLYDGTHRRFFMREDLRRLAPEGSKFAILSRNYRLFEGRQTRWDKLVKGVFGLVPRLREFVTFQYIFSIRKPS
ncbi:MAG: hypothetical protein RI897_1282 [Verrucomicrobiota bacterium]|jgi:2-polyprenyl-3-methyl-5-hydroxy-6-metoxy-1,4-benzoquinol methylase